MMDDLEKTIGQQKLALRLAGVRDMLAGRGDIAWDAVTDNYKRHVVLTLVEDVEAALARLRRLRDPAYAASEIRRLPGVRSVVVFQDGDVPAGTDPDDIPWKQLEERLVERGNMIIDEYSVKTKGAGDG